MIDDYVSISFNKIFKYPRLIKVLVILLYYLVGWVRLFIFDLSYIKCFKNFYKLWWKIY